MKYTILVFIVYLLGPSLFGQTTEIDSLKRAIQKHPQQDRTRVNLMIELTDFEPDVLSTEVFENMATEMLTLSQKIGYEAGEGVALLRLSRANLRKGNERQAVLLMHQANSIAKVIDDPALTVRILLRKGDIKRREGEFQQALVLYENADDIATRVGDKKLAATAQIQIGLTYRFITNYPKSMEYVLKGLRSAEESNCRTCLATALSMLASTYTLLGDQPKALYYYQKALSVFTQLRDDSQLSMLYGNIGAQYRLMGKYREAVQHYNKVFSLTKDAATITSTELNLADVYYMLDSMSLASKFAFSSYNKAKQIGDKGLETSTSNNLARIYLKKGQPDSALFYARQGLDTAAKIGSIEDMRDATENLAKAFAYKKDFANAYHYHLLYINYRDSMLNSDIKQKTSSLQFNYDLEKKESQISILAQRQKVQRTYLFSALIVLLLILVMTAVLFRNNRLKQRANQLLQKQKLELQDQRDQTSKAMNELQRTQKQLIQSEKMASLGELTAGIAHEIQNPLNFVNNFSEVNSELIQELKEEAQSGNINAVLQIATGLEQNESKISHHGKRADAIVKSMLQHSRAGAGEKQATDINALVDESLRLSYNGLRAKDKSFNATLETDLDASVGRVNVVPQEITRVLVNLLNNAFYSANEKKKKLNGTLSAAPVAFEPSVLVSTKKIDNKIEICVTDNGTGIPQKVLDKIYQPFFTTKPTGEGTGLGLSMSYDIIKAHGGEMKVETKEGEYTQFTVQLPAP